VELSLGVGMPTVRSMECLMDVVGCTEGFLKRGLTIGIGRIKAAPRKSASVP